MSKRIKRTGLDQKELIELRRVLTATTGDVDNYLVGFKSIVKLSQDLWITFPLWMKLVDLDETPENIGEPIYTRADPETMLSDLLVLRSFHETVLVTVKQLFDIKQHVTDLRRRLKVELDIDALRFVYVSEIMPVIANLPVQMTQSALSLKDVTDKYSVAIQTQLPVSIGEQLNNFMAGATSAADSMADEMANVPNVDLFEATQAADTGEVPMHDSTASDDATATSEMAEAWNGAPGNTFVQTKNFQVPLTPVDVNFTGKLPDDLDGEPEQQVPVTLARGENPLMSATDEFPYLESDFKPVDGADTVDPTATVTTSTESATEQADSTPPVYINL